MDHQRHGLQGQRGEDHHIIRPTLRPLREDLRQGGGHPAALPQTQDAGLRRRDAVEGTGRPRHHHSEGLRTDRMSYEHLTHVSSAGGTMLAVLTAMLHRRKGRKRDRNLEGNCRFISRNAGNKTSHKLLKGM